MHHNQPLNASCLTSLDIGSFINPTPRLSTFSFSCLRGAEVDNPPAAAVSAVDTGTSDAETITTSDITTSEVVAANAEVDGYRGNTYITEYLYTLNFVLTINFDKHLYPKVHLLCYLSGLSGSLLCPEQTVQHLHR